MAEGARLESVYTFARIEGSNPSLTAKIISDDIRRCLKSLNLKGLGFFIAVSNPTSSVAIPHIVGDNWGTKIRCK